MVLNFLAEVDTAVLVEIGMEVEGESFDKGAEFSKGDSATVACIISDVLMSVGDVYLSVDHMYKCPFQL